jgi:serine/threonine-protein kinase
LNDQGFELMQAGRYDEAIPVLQRAVAAFGEGSTDLTLAYALYNLGRSLRLAGRPAEAIPVLERRLQFNNQRGVVKKELAAARSEAGGGSGGGGNSGGGGDDEGD